MDEYVPARDPVNCEWLMNREQVPRNGSGYKIRLWSAWGFRKIYVMRHIMLENRGEG